ncbi:hypothetical protein ACFQUU_21585 [Herbaspirillum sp. GCM10030257]|uniref:hypothetical protein n=1 Tax=Herbaspirillum sp. GCM10030257 TaxID=3273393 RepID=UPI0036186A99
MSSKHHNDTGDLLPDFIGEVHPMRIVGLALQQLSKKPMKTKRFAGIVHGTCREPVSATRTENVQRLVGVPYYGSKA